MLDINPPQVKQLSAASKNRHQYLISEMHMATTTNALKKTGLTVLSLLVALGLWLGYLQVFGNFHEVIPGRLYRSAQLSPKNLASYIDEYKIKTVINLRGEHTGTRWYDGELATVESHGAKEVNFEMSARAPLSIERTFALLDILRNAEGPVLIHCRSGADRTGLASLIYLQQIAGIDEETAEWQLSPLFGHLNLPFIKEYAMDTTWEAFEKVIGLHS